MGDVNLPVVAKRFYIFVLIGFLAIIIIAATVANSAVPSKPKTSPTPHPLVTPQPTLGPPPTLSFTVKSAVGVEAITVTNQNTGATIILKGADLPATFNCKTSDTLTFKVTASTGYRFNAWVFGDSTFQSQNPYTLKVTYPLTMEARFLMDGLG